MTSLYLLDASGLRPGFIRHVESVEPARRAALIRSGPTRAALGRLGAGLLVRTILNRYWGTDGILHTPEGNPYLPGAPYFSISHSGSLALLAVSEGRIGADIQEFRPVQSAAVAKRFFHPIETEKIRTDPDPDSVFFQIWTAKESYAKAEGRGFFLPFSSFCLLPGPSGDFSVTVPSPSPYRVRAVSVPQGYTGAVFAEDYSVPSSPVLCSCAGEAEFGVLVPAAAGA